MGHEGTGGCRTEPTAGAASIVPCTMTGGIMCTLWAGAGPAAVAPPAGGGPLIHTRDGTNGGAFGFRGGPLPCNACISLFHPRAIHRGMARQSTFAIARVRALAKVGTYVVAVTAASRRALSRGVGRPRARRKECRPPPEESGRRPRAPATHWVAAAQGFACRFEEPHRAARVEINSRACKMPWFGAG